MSALKIIETNTVMEPLKFCIAGNQYKVDSTMVKYTLLQEHGYYYLYVNGAKAFQLTKISN